MSAKPRVPSHRLHRQSGQPVVILTDALTGRRRDRLLGRYDTHASRDEYKRVVVEWKANGRRLPDAARAADLTVAYSALRDHVAGYPACRM